MVEGLRENMVKKRKLVLSGRIRSHLVDELAAHLVTLNYQSTTDEIHLFIDSKGGSAMAAFKLYDVMKSLRAPVTGIVIGDCQSAAIAVYMACQKRLATKHSSFLMHHIFFDVGECQVKVNGSLEERLKVLKDFGLTMTSFYNEVVSNATGLPIPKIEELEQYGETYNKILTAAEARELGLVHEVVDSYPLI